MFDNVYKTLHAGETFASMRDIKHCIDQLITSDGLTEQEILLLVKISKELRDCDKKFLDKNLKPPQYKDENKL